MKNPQPLVSVVTPVHNGSQYLSECIDSVLRQTYRNWEYLIVDNCSSDSTLEIAAAFAERDKRIRIYHYDEFVGVIESHNRALCLVAGDANYCKIVAADDCLFPECLEKMVNLAEPNLHVGIVGAYTLRGDEKNWQVVFDGLPYKTTVLPGREVARWHLLGGCHYVGIPTSVLYRADLVRKQRSFFPNLREHADISAFYEYLSATDFGFIHQVLAYERVHEKALGAKAKRLSTYMGSHLLDVRHYGPKYLSTGELVRRLDLLLDDYYDMLAVGVVNFRGAEFWRYHKAILEECGFPFSGLKIAKAVLSKILDLVLNPKQTIEKLVRRIQPESMRLVPSRNPIGSNGENTLHSI